MKNKSRKVKTLVITAMLIMLILAFSGCNDKAEESSTAEANTTTTTEVTTETTTTKTTTKTTTEETTTVSEKETGTATKTTATKATTTQAKTPQTEAQAEQLSHKTTTTKPAVKPTPTKVTTAAPKGHYETVHHDAVTQQVWVQDSPAETHYKIRCYCGQEFKNFDEWCVHADLHSVGTSDEEFMQHCGYQNLPYEVPATGHYETQVIVAAYDEQVWVQG